MKNIVLLSTFLIMACAHGKNSLFTWVPGRGEVMAVKLPRKWTFDPGFPERSRVHVRAGFDVWNKATGMRMYEEVPYSSDAYKKKTVVVEFVDKYSDNNTTRLGETASVTADRYIVRTKITFFRAYVTSASSTMMLAAHEAGHALGMTRHSDDMSCIMHGTIPNYVIDEPCADELKQLKAVYER